MKKKFLAVIIMITVLAMTLTGCSASDDINVGEEDAEDAVTAENGKSGEAAANEESKGDAGTVALTVWGEEDTLSMLSGMIESFQEHYANDAKFDIALVAQPDAETKGKLLSDVHNGADVFSFPDDQLTALTAAGALVPVPNADEICKANLEEAAEAATLNDTLYAYPMTADNGYFLYYDKKYFTEEDVKSLERILEVAVAAGKKFSMEFSSGWYTYAFFGNTGLEFGINDDGITNYCNWNTTEGKIKGTDIAQALLDITASPAFLNQPDGDFPQSIKNGSVIAGISGVWNAVAVKEAWGDDYGAVKLPTYTCAGQKIQMSSFTGYKMMGVNAYSKQQEWALKLADWLTNEENQTIRFKERNQGPSNINAAASDEVRKVPAIQAVIDQSQYGSLQRVGNDYWEAFMEFAEVILKGNPKKLKLQEIMDNLVVQVTSSAVE